MKMKKLLALLLAVMMIVSVLPGSALAAPVDGGGENPDAGAGDNAYEVSEDATPKRGAPTTRGTGDNLPTITYNNIETAELKQIGSFNDPLFGVSGNVYLASLPYGAEITAIDCPYSASGLTSLYGSGSVPVLVGINDSGDKVASIQAQLISDAEFTDAQFIAAHSHTDIGDIDQIGYGDMYSWLTLTEAIPTTNVTGFAVYDQDMSSAGTIVIVQTATAEAKTTYNIETAQIRVTYGKDVSPSGTPYIDKHHIH